MKESGSRHGKKKIKRPTPFRSAKNEMNNPVQKDNHRFYAAISPVLNKSEPTGCECAPKERSRINTSL